MTPIMLGILGLIAFLIFMFAGMPVPVSMALVGTVGFAIIRTPAAALQMAWNTADHAHTWRNRIHGLEGPLRSAQDGKEHAL